jgi:3-phenylpropionate/trans-cinnamate dioxygenase ferredoxin reductase subunit
MVGLQNSEDDVVVRGDLTSPNKNGLSLFYMKESRIVAADCVNRPKEFASAKQLIQSRMKLDASIIRDESIDPFEFKDHAL